MRKIFVVIRREFLERVRTKWFLISTVLGPVLMAFFIFMPILMATKGGRQRSIAVVDATLTGFGQRLTERFDDRGPVKAERVPTDLADLETKAESLARVVGLKELDGFLVVSDQTVEDGDAEYRGSNVSSQIDMQILRRELRAAVLEERLGRLGVDPGVFAQANIPVGMRTMNIRGGEATGESGEATFFLAYIMWFLLYIAILLYAVQVMGAVVEEKTTRIVEVLVSSLRPFELLAGKVVGVGAVGLFQLSIWAVAARLLLTRRELLLSMVGLSGAGDAISLPQIPIATIVVLLVFFVLGYFLYASMFAAVAATASTEAEARQAQTPVTFLLVIPAILSLVSMINEPDGALFVSLTLIPFSSPIAMPGRWVVSDVPLLDLIASVLFLMLALVFVTWVAGRIYRVGILMHGKRPSPVQIWRWLRAS